MLTARARRLRLAPGSGRTHFRAVTGWMLVAVLGSALAAWGQEKRPAVPATPAKPAATGKTPAAEAAPAAPAVAPTTGPTTTGPATTGPATTGPATAAPRKTLPGEVEPSEYIVRDKDGNFQHLLNFSFEEFIRLHKLQQQLEDQDRKPRYVLQSIALVGSAGGQYAELTCDLVIDIQESGWVRVPLRMAGAILRQEAEFKGPGEHLLYFDEQNGFVLWIRAEAGKSHKVTLKLLVPLTMVGGESQLKLNVPRAAISQLKLDVAADHALARASEGSELVKAESISAEKTQLTVLRLGGDFELSWHASESTVAAVPTILEATGALLARIDGRSVNSEVRLTVRSFGGQFDRFRLRLPPRAELVGANQAGVQLVPVESQNTTDKLVEVKLGRKTVGPVELRLVTERPHNVAQGDELLELAGFEVLGAVRQWGYIAVQVVGDWQVVWGRRRNVRQVDELPESLRRDDLVAGFEYYVQPCSLTARVVPQKTRVSVEPEYLFLVGAHQTQLQAKWKYTVRGAKLRALEVELPGWEIDELGPANLINPETPLNGDSSELTIPLSQPTAGQFEITMRAHRTTPVGSKTLELELPRPQADAVAPALAVVLPADNVELRPNLDATTALVPLSLRPPLKLPERQQDPLVFRAESLPARFGATFDVHPQAISADVSSNVTIDEQATRVEQRLTYQVAYEAVDQLTVHVPRVLSLESLAVSLDGQPLPAAAAQAESTIDPHDLVTLRLHLPGPRIGRCELRIAYTVEHEKLMPATTMSLVVPLVMPGVNKLLHNQLTVSAQGGIQAVPRKGSWTTDGTVPAARQPMALAAKQAVAELPLAVELKQRQAEGKTVIDCGWIQTLFTEHGRQERIVYRFRTGERQLRVSLPHEAEARSVDVLVDGRPLATPEADVRGELLVPLTSSTAGSAHVLEIHYHVADGMRNGMLEAALPELRPATWMRRCYWQVVLPANQHLLCGPNNFTNEFTWQRQGLWWERQPAIRQHELESLLGVTGAWPVPAGANSYLFSTVGAVDHLKVWAVSRTLLVFVSSLGLLALGLAWIYFPVTRHPAVLLVLAVAVLSASLIQPETAVLVAQAATLGMALWFVAVLLARRSLRPMRKIEAPRGSSRAMLDRSLTEAYFRSGRGASPSSTATAPMAVPLSSPEDAP